MRKLNHGTCATISFYKSFPGASPLEDLYCAMTKMLLRSSLEVRDDLRDWRSVLPSGSVHKLMLENYEKLVCAGGNFRLKIGEYLNRPRKNRSSRQRLATVQPAAISSYDFIHISSRTSPLLFVLGGMGGDENFAINLSSMIRQLIIMSWTGS